MPPSPLRSKPEEGFLAPVEGGAPAAHAAAYRGDRRALRRLFAEGVSVDTRDDGGRTPLFFARSVATVRFLLACGASPTSLDARGLDAPAYWAIRPSPPFRPHDHAILMKAWPVAAGSEDWPARSLAAASMRPVALHRELARWNGVPSSPAPEASFLGNAARKILHQEQAADADAERLLMLAATGECRAAPVAGIGSGLLALLALQHCPNEGRTTRGTGAVRAGLWRDWLETSHPRASMDAALHGLGRDRTPAFAALQRVRMSAAVMGLRGDRAFGRLASGDASTREDERSRWGAWGLSGVLAISPLREQVVGPHCSALSDWNREMLKVAQGRAPLPGTPWGALLWVMGHTGNFSTEGFLMLRARLEARGATLSLAETTSAAWEEALASWRTRRAGNSAWFATLDAWKSQTLLRAELPSARSVPRLRF